MPSEAQGKKSRETPIEDWEDTKNFGDVMCNAGQLDFCFLCFFFLFFFFLLRDRFSMHLDKLLAPMLWITN
jgi:hypothetical protein